MSASCNGTWARFLREQESQLQTCATSIGCLNNVCVQLLSHGDSRCSRVSRTCGSHRHDRWDDPHMRTPYQSVGSVRTTFDPSTFGSGLLEACDGELDWKEGGN